MSICHYKGILASANKKSLQWLYALVLSIAGIFHRSVGSSTMTLHCFASAISVAVRCTPNAEFENMCASTHFQPSPFAPSVATAIAFGLIAALHLLLSNDKCVQVIYDGAIGNFAERWLIYDDPSLLRLSNIGRGALHPKCRV